jgi:CDGSH-type Zn-finger protein/uncharacterized Fe-S cluster protein YjdI
MNPAMGRAERVRINHSQNAHWLDIGNALYTTSLRCLLQGFTARDRHAKATWLAASFALTQDSAAAFVAARLGELKARAQALPITLVAGEVAGTWQQMIDLIEAQRVRLAQWAGINVQQGAIADGVQAAGSVELARAAVIRAGAASPVGAVAPAGPAVPAEVKVEVANGRDVTIRFNASRCIHSRHCVLDAPMVFKANTPGDWITPDAMPVADLVAVAHNCPSGAIQYERHDGGLAESALLVNILNVRENGPYAIHASLEIAGQPEGFRATLCRCGQSKNKPFCDGSHVAAKFVASGEPATGSVEPLTVRNGPLAVSGNLEACSGTGRTIAKLVEARLCRCGQSQNKPYCDMSYLAAGFEAQWA